MSDKELEMEEYEEFDTILLTMEDNTEVECAVMGNFEVEGNEYIALIPIDDEEEKEVLLYRFKELENDELEINMIETDEEFEKVVAVYNSLLDEEEGCGCGHDHHHHHENQCDADDNCGCEDDEEPKSCGCKL